MKGLQFYSTVAQILPILVIVAVFELRVFESWRGVRHSWRWKRWGVPAIFILAGVGEWRALLVLQHEHVARADPIIVWGALSGLASFMAGIVSELAASGPPRTTD